MRTWIKLGQHSSFPLYLFFFPQGFLTGVLQTHARLYSVAINALDFSFAIANVGKNSVPLEELRAPRDGVYVYGLWMEGARF